MKDPTIAFKLNDLEKMTPLWIKLRDYHVNRLAEMRIKNDSETLTPEQTNIIRGQIREIKRFLSIEKNEVPKFVDFDEAAPGETQAR